MRKENKSEMLPSISPNRIRADIDIGLTSEQVAQRKEEGLDNKPVESPSKTVKEILADNILTYFNLLFAILAALIIAVGSYRDLTFLPVINCKYACRYRFRS